jgi:hypothetical protein
MKYLTIFLSVIVTGHSLNICLVSKGTTLHLLLNTFQNLTAENIVFDFLAKEKINISDNLFVIHITLVALTALSVEINKNFLI